MGTEVSPQGMLWPPECTLHEDKDLCLFCTLIYPKCLEQCLIHSRCSINYDAKAERWVTENIRILRGRKKVGWCEHEVEMEGRIMGKE